MTLGDKIRILRKQRNMTYEQIGNIVGVGKSTVRKWENGMIKNMRRDKIGALARALGTTPTFLMEWDEEDCPEITPFPAPAVAEDVVTFPVMGEVAAGYDHVALESWEGDTVDIPRSYLRGHLESEYMVLRVCGDSMYPFYLEGDRVLILRTPTLDYSGQIGCVRYDGENATLKRVEYVEGENWMRLVPLNPMHPPRLIEGADLDQCSILGIPRLLIRDLND